VQAEDGIGRRVLERALLDHQLGAAFLARGRQLLGGLEDELDRAGETIAQAGEDGRDGHQDGDVGVVAAGVHDAHVLAVPCRPLLRRERHVGALLDRQPVHVGAQGDHWPRQPAAQHADDAGDRDLRADVVEAELLQVGGDDRGGADLAVAELRVRMQVAPPGDQLRFDRRHGGVDLGGESVHGNASGGHGVSWSDRPIVSGRAARSGGSRRRRDQPASVHSPGWLGRAP
jgi:hypothetical protein